MSRTSEYFWTFPSSIRGFHVYKLNWTPYKGEIVTAQTERENIYDINAVCFVNKDSGILGHVPRELSQILNYFIKHSGSITATVTDAKYKHSKIAGGLEIHADYRLSGDIKLVCKAKKLISDKLEH